MRPSLRKGAHSALSSAAWQEIRVRFGRDDKGEGGASNQDLLVDEWTADPSTPLRSCQDDKGWAALPFRFDAANDEQQVPPRRFATAGMTLLFGCWGGQFLL